MLRANTGNSLDGLLQRYARALPLTAHGAAEAHRYEDYRYLYPRNDDDDHIDSIKESTNNCDSSHKATERQGDTSTDTATPPGLIWTALDTAMALQDLARDTYLGLSWYHSDPLPHIEQACQAKGILFLDYEFPMQARVDVTVAPGQPPKPIAPGIITSSNVRDLLQSGEPKRIRRIQHFVQHATDKWFWKRVSTMNNPASSKLRSLFVNGSSIQAQTVIQGKVGNCGFCSGLASVAASFPHIIRQAFGEHSERCLASCGAISVQLHLPGRVEPRYLLLDDFVLCMDHSSQDPALYKSPSIHAAPSYQNCEVLWPRLLEKVFVKVQGSYASLDGYYKYHSLYRHPGRAMQLLTGSPLAVELHWKQPDDSPSSEHRSGQADLIYTTLAATQGRYARIAHCRSNRHGLFSNHGYSLLWISQCSVEGDTSTVGLDDQSDGFSAALASSDSGQHTVRLVCLRNPHGRGSYMGPAYGAQSRIWHTRQGQQVIAQLLQLDGFEATIDAATVPNVTWRNREKTSIPGRNGIAMATNSQRALIENGIFFMDFATFVECFPIVTMVGPISIASSQAGAPDTHALTVSTTGMTAVPQPIDCTFQIHLSNLDHTLEIMATADSLAAWRPEPSHHVCTGESDTPRGQPNKI
jgi:Calpain family cysteine protease